MVGVRPELGLMRAKTVAGIAFVLASEIADEFLQPPLGVFPAVAALQPFKPIQQQPDVLPRVFLQPIQQVIIQTMEMYQALVVENVVIQEERLLLFYER